MPATYVLRRSQTVPCGLREVFPFFAEPRNLARITPNWLGFRIVSTGDLTMRAGLRIEYRVRPLGLPLTWVSEITVWEPPHRFVDEQHRGPYRRWRHLHVFREVADGTELVDEVTYALPFGPLGALAHALVVRRQLAAIFDHRARVVRELFGDGSSP